MFAYIIRRLLLIVPTLFGIMVLNFVIIHSAPGGPVEQLLAKLQQTDVSATERFSGGGDQREVEASKQQSRDAGSGAVGTYRGARGIDPEFIKEIERQSDIGELRINISGCINACGHHHVGHIGILGVEKNGEEFYQITLGGSSDTDADIGKRVGPAFASEDVVNAVETLVDTYRAERRDGERFLDTYRRVGDEPFKDALYAAH